MKRKMVFLAVLFNIFLSASGCADFELHVRKEAYNLEPAVILIGRFDSRSMSYDPYTADEFRDALKYEFFKRGYNAVIVPAGEVNTSGEAEQAIKICKDNSGDILVKGCISQRESGFLSDRETETLISFKIYRKDGVIIGEGFYYDKNQAGKESLRRDAADDFVSALIRKTGQAE